MANRPAPFLGIHQLGEHSGKRWKTQENHGKPRENHGKLRLVHHLLNRMVIQGCTPGCLGIAFWSPGDVGRLSSTAFELGRPGSSDSTGQYRTG